MVEKADMDFWKMIVVPDRCIVAHLFCFTRKISSWCYLRKQMLPMETDVTYGNNGIWVALGKRRNEKFGLLRNWPL